MIPSKRRSAGRPLPQRTKTTTAKPIGNVPDKLAVLKPELLKPENNTHFIKNENKIYYREIR